MSSSNLPRLAIGLWLLVSLIIGVRVFLKPQVHSVVPIYLAGAADWRAGDDIYVIHPGLDFYRYSPLFAVLWEPALYLPEGLVGVVWRWFGAAFLLVAMGVWAKRLLPRELSAKEWAVWLMICLPVAAASYNNGQANLLMTGLVLWGLAAASEDKCWWTAILLIPAVFLKLYPLAVVLLVFTLAPRRFAVPCLVVTIVGFALPFGFQKPAYVMEQYHEWGLHLGGNDRSDMPLPNAYRDFMLLFRVYAQPLPYKVYQVTQLLTGAGIAAICLAMKRSGQPARTIYFTMSCLVCGWMTAFGPATESCTYILAAPAFAAATIVATGRSRPVLIAALTVFVSVHFAGLFPNEWRVQVLGPQPVTVLVFLIVTTAEAVIIIRNNQRSVDVPVTPAVAA